MVIAINTRFLQNEELEGYGYFTKEVFFRIAAAQPQHQFIFIFDRAFDQHLQFPVNVTPIIVKPKARHALSFKWWFDVKIPIALKKHKADVFVSPDGFCSLTTKVPQVLVVHDLAFNHYPSFIPKHHLIFYKFFTGRFLRKASVVATVSDFSKHDIIKTYKVPEQKIVNVSSAAKLIFEPVEWNEREAIKEQYAYGCEYFVFAGGIHPRKNLLNLLKAFSLFKRRQHTNMKLLIVGRLAWHYKETTKKLNTYKFRGEVKLLGYLPEKELAKVVGSAYALVFPSLFEGFGVPILEAMQSGVPVVTSNTSSMPEVGGPAALYADPTNPEDIAEQLKLIFKDEPLRNRLIEEGKHQATKFSWEATAAKMWQVIEQAVSK